MADAVKIAAEREQYLASGRRAEREQQLQSGSRFAGGWRVVQDSLRRRTRGPANRIDKCPDNLRIELVGGTALEFGEGVFRRPGFLISAGGGNGVGSVCDCYDSCS